MVAVLAEAVMQRDRATGGHGRRVVLWVDKIGKKLGLSEMEIEELRWSAILHDVGKLGIEDRILKKPLSPAVSGCVGAIPAGLLSEFGKSYVYSDGNVMGLLLGGISQAVQLVDTFTNSKPNDEDEVYATVP